MIKIKLSTVLILVILLYPYSYAQQSVLQFANATGRVIDRLAIDKIDDLRFGTIISSKTPGTVTISTESTRSSTGGVTLIPSDYGASFFKILGTPYSSFALTIPTASIYITNNNNASMEVKTWTKDRPARPTLNSMGYLEVRIGATLVVDTFQEIGNYTGTFTVTVNY